MKCTDKEWNHCRVEKMGCLGCYYDERKKDTTLKISIPLITEEEQRTIDNNFESIIEEMVKQITHDKDLMIAQYIIKKQQSEIEKLKKEKEIKEYYQRAFNEVRQQKEEILKDKNVVLKSTLKEILEKYRYAPADNIDINVQFYKELKELL